MKTPITQQAAHLAELCHGQTVEDATVHIEGFLRVLHAEHERKVKLLREACSCLAAIAVRWENDGLDESRPSWGDSREEAAQKQLVSGRGGKQLLTIGDCFKAKAAVETP